MSLEKHGEMQLLDKTCSSFGLPHLKVLCLHIEVYIHVSLTFLIYFSKLQEVQSWNCNSKI